MNIPIEFIEEHNEAFLAWHRFVELGYIGEKGNYLLHIDHHDDFVTGSFRFDPNRIPNDIETIKDITYNMLGIADFIVPAIHKKLFSTMHILKNTIPMPIVSSDMISICTDDSRITVKQYLPLLHKNAAEENEMQYSRFVKLDNGLGDERMDVSLMPDGKYVLDIDLDYFCWDDSLSTVGAKRIEITESAYEEYCKDLYHPFKILPIRIIHAVKEGGKYYLEYREPGKPEKVFTEDRIEKRIVKLVDWLFRQDARPAAIDICASRHSGYLPSYAWPFVKDRLIAEFDKRGW